MHGAQTNFFITSIGNSSKKGCCSGQQNETTTSMWHVDYRDTTSCWSNTTQNHTDHTRFELQESHQTYVIHNTFQLPFCFPSKVEHPWKSRSHAFIQKWYGDEDFLLESSLILDTEKDRWPNHMFTDGTFERKPSRTYAKHVEDCKVGAEDLIAQKFELNTDLTLEHFQIHQTAVFMHHPPTATQTTSIMNPSWIETISVPMCPKQVHQPQHNHGRADHGPRQMSHGNFIGNILAWDIRRDLPFARKPIRTISVFFFGSILADSNSIFVAAEIIF